MTQENYTFAKRFATWIGLAGLVFGAFCGGATASGAYATTHFAKFGGGYMLVFSAMFAIIMSIACILGLNVVKAYNVTNYNQFYMALYGLQDENANPVLKKIVSVVFDFYTILKGIAACAGALALMGMLGKSMLGLNNMTGAFIAAILFACLCVFGGSFLRRFNTTITVALLVLMLVILGVVCSVKGDVLASRLTDFQTGLDWSGVTLRAGFLGVFAYCMNTGAWGATLSSYSERLRDEKDIVGSGITIGIVVTTLFVITSCIVLPYLPEELNSTPILNIITTFGMPVLMVMYWIIILLSAISTGPAYGFSICARFEKIWKSEKVNIKVKRLVISGLYMLLCWFISRMGLTKIVSLILGTTGTISCFIIWIPLFIAIPRVHKLRKQQKAA